VPPAPRTTPSARRTPPLLPAGSSPTALAGAKRAPLRAGINPDAAHPAVDRRPTVRYPRVVVTVPATKYTLPAEWEPHAACWTAWPSHPALWLEDLAPARAAVAALCRALTRGGETVRLLAPARDHAALIPLCASLHDVPFGDIWLRDTGPVFVRDAAGCVTAARFAWNGWGSKYVFDHDAQVGDAVAAIAQVPIERHAWVLEGGAIDSDGAGTVLTTRQCLLNPNRNPSLDQPAVERALGDALGVTRVLWLDRGLYHDHTDGHVDNVARFVAPGVVACMEPAGAGDPQADVLRDTVRTLTAHGLEVVTLPSPGRVEDPSGAPLPASYLNFVLGERVVAVPTYATAHDERALAILDGLWPQRTAVGIDCRGLLTGGGGLHCITREQPR